MGGNTISIIKYLVETGANQLLLDYTIPLKDIATILDRYKIAFRINIDPGLVSQGEPDQIALHLRQILKFLNHRPNLLIGTGILMRNTPLPNIQFIRNFIIDYYRGFMNK
jgi:uroporphyrinogen-III decarboxylase